MAFAAGVLLGLFLVIYLPGAGHGFIQDDFRWIVESRANDVGDLVALFGTNTGFYRPVVAISFALDHLVWGVRPFGYALTNLALCLAAAGVLFGLARRLQLAPAAALAAAAVWLLNFHAVNMAVLWVSGRTALLAALFSLGTAHAMLRGMPIGAGILALLAMLSKEEAIALPILFAAYRLATERRLRAIVQTVPLWLALVVYLALRLQSGAFWPADAPDYYQFSFAPATVARNVLEYADRAGTAFAIVAIACAAAARVRWPGISHDERRVLGFAALWIISMFVLTVLLPVRSSLYALLPSIGSALIVGVVASAATRRHPARFRTAAIALIVLAVALVPVYWSRNVRWVRPAEVSERALQAIRADAAAQPAGHIVLVDAPAERFNLDAAFGALFPEAVRLYGGDAWTGEIVANAAEAQRRGDLVYRFSEGQLRRVR